jgi:DNA-binding NtrC family response regulator
MRVLLVEDDAALRASLGNSLEAEGWEAETAATAEEALKRISELHFDLVITDYNVGCGENGLVLLGHLREKVYSIPAILMSGYGERWLEDAARESGVFAFFVKPFPLEPFLDACRQAHEKHPERRAQYGMRKQLG